LLGEKGFDEVFGARPLKRAIQDMVVDKLSEEILRIEIKKDDTKDETVVNDKKVKQDKTIVIDAQEVTDDKGVTEKKIVMHVAPVVAMANTNT
jgi:ATP-dependent Clp protease ATP-binding subunit ClpC